SSSSSIQTSTPSVQLSPPRSPTSSLSASSTSWTDGDEDRSPSSTSTDSLLSLPSQQATVISPVMVTEFPLVSTLMFRSIFGQSRSLSLYTGSSWHPQPSCCSPCGLSLMSPASPAQDPQESAPATNMYCFCLGMTSLLPHVSRALRCRA